MVVEGGWTVYDKLAGMLALVLVSGYYLSPVGHAVATNLNLILGPLATLVPFSAFLFCLSGATGLSSTALQLLLRDAERLERLQDRMKDLQRRMKGAGEDDALDDLAEEQRELVSTWTETMKIQFRPMVWSMLLTVPTFLWIRWAVANPAAAAVPVALTLPVVGQIALTATLVGPIQVWLVWYVGGSIASSVVSRRVLSRVVG